MNLKKYIRKSKESIKITFRNLKKNKAATISLVILMPLFIYFLDDKSTILQMLHSSIYGLSYYLFLFFIFSNVDYYWRRTKRFKSIKSIRIIKTQKNIESDNFKGKTSENISKIKGKIKEYETI